MARSGSQRLAKNQYGDDTARALDEAQESWVHELAQEHTELAIATLAEIAADSPLVPDESGEHLVPEKDAAGNVKHLGYGASPRVAAAKALLEHGWGRPTTRVQHSGTVTNRGLAVVIVQQGEGGQFEKVAAPAPALEIPAEVVDAD